MKTAAQHNASQVGHSEFKPNSNEARIIGGDQAATQMLAKLFKSFGWKVVTVKPKRKKGKSHGSKV